MLKALRSVEIILTKNANKHSKEFMDGMDLVRGVESDLAMSKEMVHHTKAVFNNMKAKVAIRAIEIMKLARKKKRLILCKKILVEVYKRFHDYNIKINELIEKCEYFDALSLIDEAIADFDATPEDPDMAVIKENVVNSTKYRKKLMHKRELVEQKTSQGLGDTISNFNVSLYSK